jgi:hypothetical protein
MKGKLLSILLSSLLIFVSIGMVVSFPSKVSATGNTYYVSNNSQGGTEGSDSNNGTSLLTPWLTIAHASSVVVAGDTVYVETGTYNESYLYANTAGTAGNPITFSTYNSEVVTITAAVSYPSFVVSADYITLNGFTFNGNVSDTGIYVNHAHDILQNLIIHGTYNSGIAVAGATYLTIDGCTVYDNGSNSHENITIEGATNLEIKNCDISSPVISSAGIDVKTGSTYVSIHNNVIHNVTGGDSGIYMDNQAVNQNNISIYDNIIHDVGVAIGDADEIGGSSLGLSIYNNLIYNNTYGFHSPVYTLTQTTSIINNTFYNNSITIDFDNPAADQTGCIIRNNIIDQNSGNAMLEWAYNPQAGITVDHNLFYDPTATYNTQYGTSYQKGNPNLSNPTTSFALTTSSTLAINNGSSTNAPATDYIGTARPQDGGYDIGAYEFIAPVVTISAASSVTLSSAVLNGNITVSGGNNPTVTIYYGTSDGGNVAGNWANNTPPTSPVQPQGIAAFYYNLSGLTANTTYYYNAYAVNGAGGVWAGASQSFTTALAATATLTISAASVVSSTSATLSGNVTSIGGASPTVTLYWGTADGDNHITGWQGISAPSSPNQPQGIAAFSLNITGLTPATTYYFNASATNTAGISWAGASLSFTTPLATSWNYYFPIIITDTSGVARTNVSVLTDIQGTSLIGSNYINANGTDTRMKLHSAGNITDTDEPYMMGTTQIPIVIPSLPASGSVEYDLYTGCSPVQTSFPIIVGNGGYITTADNAALEPGENFSIVTSGYVNTTAGSNENIIFKSGALQLYVDPTTSGTIDAYTYGTATTSSQTSVASADILYGGSNIRAGERFTSFTANQIITSIQFSLYKVGSPTGTASIVVRKSSDNTILGTLGTIDVSTLTGGAVWYTFNTNAVPNYSNTDIRICVEYSGGDSGDKIVVGYDSADVVANAVKTDYLSSWTDTSGADIGWQSLTTYPMVLVSGISSGVHTITLSETTASSGTLSLQVDSGAPSTVTSAGSVPDTANAWYIDQNNVMPYITSYVETVGATEVIKYQPTVIISGTTLPNIDSTGLYPGVINWGLDSVANDVTITYGALTAYNSTSYSGTVAATQGYQLPVIPEPANWYGNNSNLANLPLYGVFLGIYQSTGIPVQTLYFIIMMLTAFMLFFFTVMKTHSIMISGVFLVVLLAMASGTGVIPGWIVYVLAIGSIGVLFLARQIG